MSVDETPIDCFRVLYKITGSKDEIRINARSVYAAIQWSLFNFRADFLGRWE